jgi:hypothetical protein
MTVAGQEEQTRSFACGSTRIENDLRLRGQALGENAFQANLTALPVRHHLSEKVEEARTMMGLSDMTKLVRNDVVDGINWRFDKPSIEHQPARRRHRSPPLAHLTNDHRPRPEGFHVAEPCEAGLQAVA